MTPSWALLLLASVSLPAGAFENCPALDVYKGREELCRHEHPSKATATSRYALCVPLAPLLALRSRIVRLLLREDLSVIAPRAEWTDLLKLANLGYAWAPDGCPEDDEELKILLALCCAGLLEAEAKSTPLNVTQVRGELSKAAAALLPALIRCPWARLAKTGWPLFALLGRWALRVSLTYMPRSTVLGQKGCAHGGRLADVVLIAAVKGFPLPDLEPGAISVPWFHIARDQGEAAAVAYCLWRGADGLGFPEVPVCVEEHPFIPAEKRRHMLAARDCNVYWPDCSDWGRNGGIHFRMLTQHRRDLAADMIREEQRPYCVVNQRGALSRVTAELVARLRQLGLDRPLRVVEVGANYGDCTLLAHATALHAQSRIHATAFEANPDVFGYLQKNMLLNNVTGESHLKAVMDTASPAVEILVPGSSVHATTARNDVRAGNDLPQDKAQVWPAVQDSHLAFQVEATTLDGEIDPEEDVDLLLLCVNGGELKVLEGARRVIGRQHLQVLFAMTWHLESFTAFLEEMDFYIEEQIAGGGSNMWVLARPKKAQLRVAAAS